MKFFKPDDLKQAYDLKKKNPDAFFLGGGTFLNSKYFMPNSIISLISLENLGLNKIKENYLGAMVTLENIKIHSELPKSIKTSAGHVFNRNIRNMATIGGNLGANRTTSDMIPVLFALESEVEFYTNKGKKKIPLIDWIKKPVGIILGIHILKPEKEVFQRRFSRTKNDLFSMKFVAGYFWDSDSNYKDVIIAVGGLSDKVFILEKTSNFLNSKNPKTVEIGELQKIAQSEIKPETDIRSTAEYKRHILNTTLEEFIAG
jgi:putative selenate reductase FAD-binding subunit